MNKRLWLAGNGGLEIQSSSHHVVAETYDTSQGVNLLYWALSADIKL